MHFIKKIAIVIVVGAICYVLLGYHFIVVGNSVKLLKKSSFTLKYTIFSTKTKSIESILAIEELWEDGIGELLVEVGMMSEEALERYKEKLEEEE